MTQNAVTLQGTAGKFAAAGQAVEYLQEQKQGELLSLHCRAFAAAGFGSAGSGGCWRLIELAALHTEQHAIASSADVRPAARRATSPPCHQILVQIGWCCRRSQPAVQKLYVLFLACWPTPCHHTPFHVSLQASRCCCRSQSRCTWGARWKAWTACCWRSAPATLWRCGQPRLIIHPQLACIWLADGCCCCPPLSGLVQHGVRTVRVHSIHSHHFAAAVARPLLRSGTLRAAWTTAAARCCL